MNVLKIIDKRELSYIILIQIVFKFGYIDLFPFLKDILPIKFFFLSLFSIIFIILSGYFINTYFNSKNTRYKNNKTIFILFVLFSFLGLFLGVYTANKTKIPFNSFIFIIFWFIVVFLSNHLDKKSFLKSLITSLLLAFCTLIIWRFSNPTTLTPSQWKTFLKLEIVVILYTILIFASNIIRTILIDLRFFKKDKANNFTTIPTVFGIQYSKIAILIIITICFICIIFISLFYLKNINVFLSLIFIELIPFFYLYKKLKKAKSNKEYHKIIIIFDFVLFLGFLSIPLVAYSIKNAI